ncbi:MAG: hypothetical protein LBT71_03300 [Azoarcus sp.]|nr:hypothetical protein [Azoarcus sp.]
MSTSLFSASFLSTFLRTLYRCGIGVIAGFAFAAFLNTPVRAAEPVVIGEGLSVGWAQFFIADAEKLWQK